MDNNFQGRPHVDETKPPASAKSARSAWTSAGLRRMPRRTSEWSWRDSITVKAAINAAPTASSPMVGTLAQPRAGASTTA
ncbi:hypothetical protein ABZS93_12775 [Streptomyces sp900116325]|uniref:hypothetical protein n=1 Tax=Streptomyces sp. 900116325 TaxID=3154295 RepID=UPI0033AF8927